MHTVSVRRNKESSTEESESTSDEVEVVPRQDIASIGQVKRSASFSPNKERSDSEYYLAPGKTRTSMLDTPIDDGCISWVKSLVHKYDILVSGLAAKLLLQVSRKHT
jgi:hypothetical protein